MGCKDHPRWHTGPLPWPEATLLSTLQPPLQVAPKYTLARGPPWGNSHPGVVGLPLQGHLHRLLIQLLVSTSGVLTPTILGLCRGKEVERGRVAREPGQSDAGRGSGSGPFRLEPQASADSLRQRALGTLPTVHLSGSTCARGQSWALPQETRILLPTPANLPVHREGEPGSCCCHGLLLLHPTPPR